MIKLHKLTTSRVGVYQSIAYRRLEQLMHDVLGEYEITMTEWALLGLVNEQEYTTTELADIMQYEVSHITNVANCLIERKLLDRQRGKQDKRQKFLTLTNKGERLVSEVEPKVRSHLRKALDGIGRKDALSYLKILKKLSDN